MKPYFVLIIGLLLGIALGNYWGCAPLIGTTQLVYQSSPEKPIWLRVKPQSRTYQFFIGVSDNAPSVDEALRLAMLNAFEEAITQAGVEVSVKYEALTTERQRRIRDEISLSGLRKLGMERVAWYYEQWERYTEKGAETYYRAYVLMRSRKTVPSSFISSAFHVIFQRFDATWHSMLLPGWGQKLYGKEKESDYFLYLTTSFGAVWLGSTLYYEKLQNDRSKLEKDLAMAFDEVEKENLRKKLSNNDDLRRYTKKVKRYAAYFTIGFYAVNLLDAMLLGPPSYRTYAGGWQWYPQLYSWNENGTAAVGLGITYHFPVKKK